MKLSQTSYMISLVREIDMISKVQVWCNALPKKILGYQTPDEAFKDSIHDILYC